MINLYESIFGGAANIAADAKASADKEIFTAGFTEMGTLDPNFTIEKDRIIFPHRISINNTVESQPDFLDIAKKYDLQAPLVTLVALNGDYNSYFKKIISESINIINYTSNEKYEFENINFKANPTGANKDSIIHLGMSPTDVQFIKNSVFDCSAADGVLWVNSELEFKSTEFINVKKAEVSFSIYERIEKTHYHIWKKNNLSLSLSNNDKDYWNMIDIKKFYNANKKNIKIGRKFTPFYIWNYNVSKLRYVGILTTIPSIQSIKLKTSTYNYIIFTKDKKEAEQYYTDVDQLLTPDGWYACLILK